MPRPAYPFAFVITAALNAALALLGEAPTAKAQTDADPAQWEVLSERFESTGGGGWMIEGYRPVVIGERCETDFTAVSPDGRERFANRASFTARPHKGGTLCTDGQWRARDGSASGTTPIRLFIKDGVVRRVP